MYHVPIMRVVLIITFFLAPAFLFAAESLPVSKVVNYPLADIRPAVDAYLAVKTYYTVLSSNGPIATNLAAGDFVSNVTAITNAAGELRVRFCIAGCSSIPMCYIVDATTLNPKSTRIEVRPMDGIKVEGTPDYRVKRATRILTGVMAALEKKQ